MNQREPKSVTIEDLLKLKRLERPSANFWTEFERELRAKQLAAIVENRPWWHRLSRPAIFLSRQHIPIGAMAVLALTWVSVRQFDANPTRGSASARLGEEFETASALPSASAPVASRALTRSTATSASSAVAAYPSSSTAALEAGAEAGSGVSGVRPLSLPREEAESDSGAEEAYVSSDAVPSSPVMGSLVPVSGSHLTPAPAAASSVAMSAIGGAGSARTAAASWSSSSSSSSVSSASAGAGSDELFSPSARLIASNLIAVREADPDSAHRFLVANQGFAATTANATVMHRLVDPMTRMNPVSEERRSRLLSSSLPAPGGAEVISTAMTERSETRLSSDRLYDSISRYGVDGHSISIKF
jgi:hypothetical protein